MRERIETLEAENEQLREQLNSDDADQTASIGRRGLLRFGSVGVLSTLLVGSASAESVFPVETDPRFDKIRTEILQFYLRSDAPTIPVTTGRAVVWVEDGDLP